MCNIIKDKYMTEYKILVTFKTFLRKSEMCKKDALGGQADSGPCSRNIWRGPQHSTGEFVPKGSSGDLRLPGGTHLKEESSQNIIIAIFHFLVEKRVKYTSISKTCKLAHP